MEAWLEAALDYIPRWVDFQRQHFDQPGCAVAIARGAEIVLDRAFGVASLATGEPLTTQHRFRVASHSKTFTATGILKLHDEGRLRLDDVAGAFVAGLHPEVAVVTVGQLLSHSAGLVRDGGDSGQFTDRRPFRGEAELRADLALPPPLQPNERFKYSNHGFGLLGLIIEAVTGEPYPAWIMREVVDAAGLKSTYADIGLVEGRLASGHGTRLPLGRRPIIPGDNPTHAMASATGFVSTAADLARFFAQLSPKAETSVLSAASRRDMARRHWRDNESSLERYYGLGTIGGQWQGWDWFGHSGSFQGFITRTAVFPGEGLTVSVLTNAIDGFAHPWLDGIAHILKSFSLGGAPSSVAASWAGRFWTLWSAVDLVPIGEKVFAFSPAFQPPFTEGSEIAVTGEGVGKVVRASGFLSPGEPVRCARGEDGTVCEVWIGGVRLSLEASFVAELTALYGG